MRFQPSDSANRLRLYVFCNAHVGGEGEDNSGWAGEYKGIPMLFAEREDLAFAIACSTSFKAMSCGFMGVSDGLNDIRANRRLTELYTETERGNIALTGEIDGSSSEGEFTLTPGFGGGAAEAGQQARAVFRARSLRVFRFRGASIAEMKGLEDITSSGLV